MESVRRIKKILESKPTIEGAGVHLKRAFGFNEVPQLDPFLLLDDFHSGNPDDYIKGFPWHPHRGIETITYVLCGRVEHGDSMGNEGIIHSGDVQWMTAGSGIIHQEMPKGEKDGLMWGFQLWANVPALHKMMDPRYQDVRSDQLPEIVLDSGVKIRIICGEVNGVRGPVQSIVIDPEYLDVTVPANSSFGHSVKRDHTVFAYVIDGEGYFDGRGRSHTNPVDGANDPNSMRDLPIGSENLILFNGGDEVVVSAGDKPVRFLLISGKPIAEPVAWYGPIVMNTQEELRIAFEEYQNGTFIKHRK
ncbi:MAG: pirin family protein [Proteobacteria bacterium]|nr:pirin family protein [Pseudomonadota bacterium]NIS68098.1 pirin family protein [Pseudomonadota bacterium]